MYRLEDSFWWYRGLHARVLSQARACLAGRGMARILDAGCGTGGMAARLASLGPVTALDLSPHALSFAARRSLSRLARATVERLPVEGGSFDLVVSLDVLGQAEVDPETAVREMARVLCPGGHLILNLPAGPSLLSEHDRQVGNLRRFDRRQARDLLVRAGLEADRIACWNSLLFPVCALVRLYRRRRSDGASELTMPPGIVNAALTAVLQLEARLATRVSFPCGLSILVVAHRPAAK